MGGERASLGEKDDDDDDDDAYCSFCSSPSSSSRDGVHFGGGLGYTIYAFVCGHFTWHCLNFLGNASRM